MLLVDDVDAVVAVDAVVDGRVDAVDMEVEGLVDTVSSRGAGLGKLSMADKSKPVPLVPLEVLSEEGASFMDSAIAFAMSS